MTRSLIFLFVLQIFSADCFGQENTNENPPNIVLILIDDSGLMDFGSFGGEAQTPNIDSLAKCGTMFTNMHASPVCAPSRAMLLTGSDNHLAGVANLPEMLPKEYQELKGYAGVLNDSVQTIATRLKELNYNTYVTGKWHLGHDENTLPTKKGFDRSFILGASGADNYEASGYLPMKSTAQWYAEGKPTDLPEHFYSSEYYVDEMIRFHREETDSKLPFFSYIAFQAIHAPVQAPKEFVEKYQAIYSEGWDVLREKRFTKAKQMGIIPEDAAMNPMLEEMNPWASISEKDKKTYITDMAVMAGMLDAMDYHVGRYIAYLKEIGEAENTIFIITSDNGPDGGDYEKLYGWAKRNGFHRDFDKNGGKRYYGTIGPEFASAIAAPFSYFKYYAGEGGLRVPLIISGLKASNHQIDNSFCFITDIAPTIYDIVGLSTSENKGYHPISGKSMLPHIENNSVPIYDSKDGVGLEAAASSAYFLGDIKIVKNNTPLGDKQWKMYNLKIDPAETTNITSQNPILFQTLLSKYELFAKNVGVQPMPEGYNAQKEVGRKSLRAMLNPFKK